MILSDVASIRTGIVTGRKKADDGSPDRYDYRLLNLKCVSPEGVINTHLTEPYSSVEPLKASFLTQKGDILVRLSVPYSATLIQTDQECGLLVPSHFAIIRLNSPDICPEYLLWFLKRDSTYQQILLNASGSSAFGTISSGFLASLHIRVIPTEKQRMLGELLILSEREQELLARLAGEKKRYNQIMTQTIYESFKRGNRK